MRVVSYIRMSSAAQDTSPDQQRASIAAHAKKNGYAITREYADLGVSGDNTAKRHQFKQMIADGAARKFDRIVVFDGSRFGRFDAIELGRWAAPLRDAGVELETLDQGVEDWNDFGGRIIGLVATEGRHRFLTDLSRATVRGQTAKAVENDGYSAPTPYGYRRHTELRGPKLRKRHSTLEIDPAAAAVVREIFAAYNAPAGSLKSIARALNERGVPPIRRGKEWRPNAVARILENEAYVGDAVWGRRQRGRYHAHGQDGMVKRRRGAATEFVEPIRHQNAIPAIIDRKTFAKTQQLRAEREKRTRSPGKTRALSGLVYCAQCGKPMHSDGDRLRCQNSSGSQPRNKQCAAVRIPSTPIVSAIVGRLRRDLAGPEARARLLAAIERRMAARAQAAGSDDARAALADRHRALAAEVTAGLERILAIPKSLIAEFTATLDRKAAERDRIAAELAGMPDVRPIAPKQFAKQAAGRIGELVQAACSSAEPVAVNAALRALGVRVSIRPERLPVEAEFTVTPSEAVPGDCSTTEPCSVQVPRRPLLEWRQRIA